MKTSMSDIQHKIANIKLILYFISLFNLLTITFFLDACLFSNIPLRHLSGIGSYSNLCRLHSIATSAVAPSKKSFIATTNSPSTNLPAFAAIQGKVFESQIGFVAIKQLLSAPAARTLYTTTSRIFVAVAWHCRFVKGLPACDCAEICSNSARMLSPFKVAFPPSV